MDRPPAPSSTSPPPAIVHPKNNNNNNKRSVVLGLTRQNTNPSMSPNQGGGGSPPVVLHSSLKSSSSSSPSSKAATPTSSWISKGTSGSSDIVIIAAPLSSSSSVSPRGDSGDSGRDQETSERGRLLVDLRVKLRNEASQASKDMRLLWSIIQSEPDQAKFRQTLNEMLQALMKVVEYAKLLRIDTSQVEATIQNYTTAARSARSEFSLRALNSSGMSPAVVMPSSPPKSVLRSSPQGGLELFDEQRTKLAKALVALVAAAKELTTDSFVERCRAKTLATRERIQQMRVLSIDGSGRYSLVHVLVCQRVIRTWLQRRAFQKCVSEFVRHADTRRSKLLRELEQTERIYITNLKVLLKEWVEPMKLIPEFLDLVTELSVQLADLQEILTISGNFCDELSSRLAQWPVVQLFGDLFLTYAPLMSEPYAKYVSGYSSAITTLQIARKRNSSLFSDTLKKFQQKANTQLQVEDHLILPVQRCPRYELFLRSLTECTPQEHRDYQLLQQALQKIKEVNVYVNRRKATEESAEKFAEIATQLPAAQRQLLFNSKQNPKRLFLRETRSVRIRGVHLQDTSMLKTYDCLLFSDCLLLLRKQKLKLLLYLAGVSFSTEHLPEFCFSLRVVASGTTKIYTFVLNDTAARTNWLSDLKSAGVIAW